MLGGKGAATADTGVVFMFYIVFVRGRETLSGVGWYGEGEREGGRDKPEETAP